MSSQNIPCTNWKLCGVQSHRPGTHALCQQPSKYSEGRGIASLQAAYAKEGDVEMVKVRKMFAIPELNFLGNGSHTGQIMIGGGPMVHISRTGGEVWLTHEVSGSERQIIESDYASEEDLMIAIRDGYAEIAAAPPLPGMHQEAWQSRRSHLFRSGISRSDNPFIHEDDARDMAAQSLESLRATSESRGKDDLIILKNLAGNEGTPPDVLHQIAEHQPIPRFSTHAAWDVETKLVVARNANVSTEALQVLAKHKDQNVKLTAREKLKDRGEKAKSKRLSFFKRLFGG